MASHPDRASRNRCGPWPRAGGASTILFSSLSFILFSCSLFLAPTLSSHRLPLPLSPAYYSRPCTSDFNLEGSREAPALLAENIRRHANRALRAQVALSGDA
jgi:hypothetical protein